MPDRAAEEKQLFYMEFIHRENQFRHQTRDADKLQYELLRDANPKAVEGNAPLQRLQLFGHWEYSGVLLPEPLY